MKRNVKKDKIIKNYGTSGIHSSTKKMKEIGENMLKNKATKSIKKSQQKMKKGAITEADVREKMKRRRVVVPVRKMK